MHVRDHAYYCPSTGHIQVPPDLCVFVICAELGVEAQVRQIMPAYMQSWMGVLKNDKRAIFTAASHRKAVDYLNALQPISEVAR